MISANQNYNLSTPNFRGIFETTEIQQAKTDEAGA